MNKLRSVEYTTCNTLHGSASFNANQTEQQQQYALATVYTVYTHSLHSQFTLENQAKKGASLDESEKVITMPDVHYLCTYTTVQKVLGRFEVSKDVYVNGFKKHTF